MNKFWVPAVLVLSVFTSNMALADKAVLAGDMQTMLHAQQTEHAEHMTLMHQRMAKIWETQDPDERKALMASHQEAMQTHQVKMQTRQQAVMAKRQEMMTEQRQAHIEKRQKLQAASQVHPLEILQRLENVEAKVQAMQIQPTVGAATK